MESESDNDEICTSPEASEEGEEETPINLLPEISRKKYESVYKAFMEWRKEKKIDSFSESFILDYFRQLAEKYKSPSLWARYSMLRSTLKINHNINIERYFKLRSFLKQKAQGYQAKKAKNFTADEIKKFIIEAPDKTYLATKVALIMGITGACRANELHSMKVEDVQDLGSAMLVTVPNNRTNTQRKFTITDDLYPVCKKFVDLRPRNIKFSSFFLNYSNGRCIAQKMGIGKIGSMGRQIAMFLKLPNPELYTAHSYRKLLSTRFVNSSEVIRSLKRDEEEPVRTDPVIKEEIEDIDVSDIQFNTQDTNSTAETSTTNENSNFDINSIPAVQFTNCTNITVNFITSDNV